MAVIQVGQQDIVKVFPQAASADLVIAWNKAFTDSSGAVALGNLRTALTQVAPNRWRIPALNLWTEFDTGLETGVLYSAWFEAGGLRYDWPELKEFRILVAGPVTSYFELIADERRSLRSGFLDNPIPVGAYRRVDPPKDAIFTVADEFLAADTPIQIRFGRGKLAPFLRVAGGTMYYSQDGISQAPIGSGGGGVTDGDKGHVVVSGGGATWSLDAAILTAINPPSRSVSGNTTLAPATDGLLLVNTASGNITVTLNAPTGNQRKQFYIKKISTDANAVVLTPAAGQIDGAATYSFSGAQLNTGDGLIIVFDGTNWHVFPS